MNQNNLSRLIDHLKSITTDLFNMAFYAYHEDAVGVIYYVKDIPDNSCGTVGCIAGHIAMAFKDELNKNEEIPTAAGDWLDLDEEGAAELFQGYWTKKWMGQITLEDVIQHLEGLRA